MTHTSWPALAKKAAYTDPMAPQPSMTMDSLKAPLMSGSVRRLLFSDMFFGTTSFVRTPCSSIKLSTIPPSFSSSTTSLIHWVAATLRFRAIPTACFTVMKSPSNIRPPGIFCTSDRRRCFKFASTVAFPLIKHSKASSMEAAFTREACLMFFSNHNPNAVPAIQAIWTPGESTSSTRVHGDPCGTKYVAGISAYGLLKEIFSSR
mmetsp:Transcript_9967/g.23957  ORF Transcript_9967/g.23957 Transcript_9967/m.23957 type:complete len:205 (+) Transcript_9967:800-1414(+)